MKKLKIVIIEPSKIVAYGLSQILEKEGDFSIIATLPNLSTYNDFQHGNADIILVNPMVDKSEKNDIRSQIPVRNNCAFVAITYGPYNENILHQYDSFIGLFHTEEQIAKRLLTAHENISENPQVETSNELSHREKEILTAVAKGKSNKEIADEFNLSIHTVISHRKNISHKLGINSIAGLTSYAIINKLIDVTNF